MTQLLPSPLYIQLMAAFDFIHMSILRTSPIVNHLIVSLKISSVLTSIVPLFTMSIEWKTDLNMVVWGMGVWE